MAVVPKQEQFGVGCWRAGLRSDPHVIQTALLWHSLAPGMALQASRSRTSGQRAQVAVSESQKSA